MIYDPDSVSQLDIRPTLSTADLLGVLAPGRTQLLSLALSATLGGLVRDWPPFSEGTALPLLHAGIELQQLNFIEALAEKQDIMLELFKSSSFLGNGMLKLCKL